MLIGHFIFDCSKIVIDLHKKCEIQTETEAVASKQHLLPSPKMLWNLKVIKMHMPMQISRLD